MPELSERSVRVGEIVVRAIGVAGDVAEGVPQTRGSGRASALDDILHAEEAGGGLRVRSEVTIVPRELDFGRSRGEGISLASGPPRLLIDGPPSAPEEIGQLLLVQDEGFVRFVLPLEPRGNQFEVVLSDKQADSSRGLALKLGSLAVRVIGIVGGKRLLAAGTVAAVRAYEGARRPYRLRPFGDTALLSSSAAPPDISSCDGRLSLLFLHGANSSSATCFRFPRTFLAGLESR